jgi:hypothetical protein
MHASPAIAKRAATRRVAVRRFIGAESFLAVIMVIKRKAKDERPEEKSRG